jgi:hypothetical protein
MKDNSLRDSIPDARRSRLRATIATIERALATIQPAARDDNGATATDSLRASVADLAGQLALGPEPEYRRCSACERLGMSGATVCGHCWTKLTPRPATASVPG